MSYEPKRFDFSIPVRINLSSDTQTKPSRAMKEAMMEAEVGDEQMGSDPTVWALCDRTAALLGKEAAVFLPSGTMCNQVAIATHCRPGEEILAHESSHILSSEGGGAGGDRRCADPGPEGRTRTVHRRYAGRGDPPGVALCADAASGGGGADRQPRRRRVLERRCTARGDRCGARTRAVHAHGRRAADECRGGVGRAGDRPHRRLRFGVAGFHQGSRCTFGRRACRIARVHRPGVALEAAARRLDAPGRHLRRGVHLRAGTQHRPPGRGPCQREVAGARHGADPRHHRGDAGDQPGVLRHRGHRHDRRCVRRQAAARRACWCRPPASIAGAPACIST